MLNTQRINKLLVLLILVLFTSCITNKDVVYLREMGDKQVIKARNIKAPEYKIKVGDNLYIDVQAYNSEVEDLFNTTRRAGTYYYMSGNYGSPTTQYLSGYIVDYDGTISVPMLGKIPVENLTLNEIQMKIRKRVGTMIKGAVVKVRMLNYKITILGEVHRPGTYYNYNASISVLDAISMANGITDYALVKNVLVVRQTKDGAKTYRIDLRDKNFMFSEAYFLNVNDVVYIQPDKWKSIKVNSTFYSLVISSISTLVLVLNLLK